MTWFGPAHAEKHHLPCPETSDLPTDATPRGQAEINLAGCLAAGRLVLAGNALAAAQPNETTA